MALSLKYKSYISTFAIIVLGVFLCLEIARDLTREGDFGGYIEAGKLAWENTFIYSAHRNTWPPFMSLLAIPLHGLNELSFYGIRLVWLLGIVVTYWYVFKWVLSYFFDRNLVLKLKSESKKDVSLTSSLFLIPFLLNFRIFIEELSNLQVNVTIMAICILALILTLNKKHLLAGLLLALVISTKVYPIILLPFLLFKQEYKTFIYTIIGLIISYISVLLYFGDIGNTLYIHWYTTQVAEGLQCIHFNQSLWGLICGLFSDTSRFNEWTFNVANLSISHTKVISLSIISCIGTWIAYTFYTKRKNTDALATQWLITLSFIPVFSPLAWKCYFVFLLPISILLYVKYQNQSLKQWIILPFLLITFSSELFLGNTWSDYAESLGIITISSLFISLLATYFLQYKK